MVLPETLPTGVRAKLEATGLTALEAVSALSTRELLDIPGIGPGALEAIERAVASAGLSLAEDEWAPYTCARHAEPSWDTQLVSMFLCEACAEQFKELAFSGTAPSYIGDEVEGYCLHCNELRKVRLRQWFLCGVCDRVMRSIGRSVVADRFVLEWWSDVVQPSVSDLELTLVDEPELRPRRRKREDKIAAIDFLGTNKSSGKPVFGIELKTGRSYIRGRSIGSRMQRFQLDHGDCDDILAVVEREDLLPVYLFHAQVIDRAEPPTVRFIGMGLWWTDLFAMAESYTGSARRPREAKTAAYYDTAMFRDASAFAGHVAARGPDQLQERMQQEGIPRLYEG